MFNLQSYIFMKHRFLVAITVLSLFSFPIQLHGKDKDKTQIPPSILFEYQKPVSTNPTREAEALFRYLQNISGVKLLSGQSTNGPGFDEISFIQRATGKQPAVRASYLNFSSVNAAIALWKDNGLPFMIWDWESSFDDGRAVGKLNAEQLLQEGTVEYDWFQVQLDSMASKLELLHKANIPVLWCPFENASEVIASAGNTIPEQFKKLWQKMFNYLVNERQLGNLIWAFPFSSNTNVQWFPGSMYVDIAGVNMRNSENFSLSDAANLASSASKSQLPSFTFLLSENLPIDEKDAAIIPAECIWIQNNASLLANADQEKLNEFYRSSQVVTLDKVPDLLEYYGKNEIKRQWTSGATLSFSELKTFNIGSKSNEVKISNNQLKITAKGKGVTDKKDEACFVFKQLEGDFDVSVQVLNFQAGHVNSMAGLMARIDLSKNSPEVFYTVVTNNTQNIDDTRFVYRRKKSDAVKFISSDSGSSLHSVKVAPPNTWIRLQRRGNVFKSYVSQNSIDWEPFSIHYQKMPDKLLVGIAVASSSKQNTTAEFQNFEITWE